MPVFLTSRTALEGSCTDALLLQSVCCELQTSVDCICMHRQKNDCLVVAAVQLYMHATCSSMS